MTQPLIGVGVPVWRAGAFVAETLQSVLDQRGVRIRIVISIDGRDPESERACQRFAFDPRVRIIVQPRRLGWVKNTATVLAAAGAGVEFACVRAHDDLVEPECLAMLLDAAQRHPHAAVVFSDFAAFGTMHGTVSQDSVIGTPMERQLLVLSRHYNALAYQGLNRTAALAAVPPISGNDCDDFACDTVWMARLARAGDMVRVPQVLYRKRYTQDTAHAQWTAWSTQRKLAAWVRHCLDMLAEALIVAKSAEDRRQLVEAARGRLVLREIDLGPYAKEIKAMSRLRRLQLRARFEAGAAARSDIGPLGQARQDRLLRTVGGLMCVVRSKTYAQTGTGSGLP